MAGVAQFLRGARWGALSPVASKVIFSSYFCALQNTVYIGGSARGQNPSFHCCIEGCFLLAFGKSLYPINSDSGVFFSLYLICFTMQCFFSVFPCGEKYTIVYLRAAA